MSGAPPSAGGTSTPSNDRPAIFHKGRRIIPYSERVHRHRPRARQGAPSSLEAKRLKKEEEAPVSKPERQPSGFAQWRSRFTSAESVDAFLQDKANASVFQDPKTLQTFLSAAFSGRTDDLLAAFIESHKGHVFQLLFSLYSLATTGKLTLQPGSHEFLLRCEQFGVKQDEWGSSLHSEYGTDTSVITPREILLQLARMDEVGRLQRRIELSHTPEAISKCAKKLYKLVMTAAEAHAEVPSEAGEGASVSASSSTSYSAPVQRKKVKKHVGRTGSSKAAAAHDLYGSRCLLLGKLVSKMRRVAEIDPSAPKATPRVDAEAKEMDEQHQEAPSEATEVGVEPSSHPAYQQWSEDAVEMYRSACHYAVECLEKLLKDKPVSSIAHPTTKLCRFADWAVPLHLMMPEDGARVHALESVTQECLEQTAAQMEIVMRLKALPAGDTNALEAVLDELWVEGSDETEKEQGEARKAPVGHFKPYSSDVLSSIATSAENSGIEERVQKKTSERLQLTHRYLKSIEPNAALPRRVLRFIQSVSQKDKQEALAKHIKELEGQ